MFHKLDSILWLTPSHDIQSFINSDFRIMAVVRYI